jgi:hypothetical protein
MLSVLGHTPSWKATSLLLANRLNLVAVAFGRLEIFDELFEKRLLLQITSVR